MAGDVFHGCAVPVPPNWAPVNGSRGQRRTKPMPEQLAVVIHTYEGGELRPVTDFLNAVAAPALPPNRAFQSGGGTTWYWETPTGGFTTDPAKARKSTISGTVYRAGGGIAPLALKVGDPMPWCYGPAYLAFADGATGRYELTCDPSVYMLNAQGGPPNATCLSICIPGRAARTRDEWLSAWGRKQIEGVARYILWAHERYGVPLVRVQTADLLAGKRGYCGHVDVSKAWHYSTHSDPGVNFPWDVLAQTITRIQQEQDEDMKLLRIVNPDGTDADTELWYLIGEVLILRGDATTTAFKLLGGHKPVDTPRALLIGAYPVDPSNLGPFARSEFKA